MDLTGHIIADRYEFLRLLGEGGMGQVYEARHLELDKHVAIKVLTSELIQDEELRERFRREARITASLRHANIIEVMDFGMTHEGQPYIVMELLTGESLAEVLEREGSLPPTETRRIMLQVLDGLAEAHSRNIIHRDLKPDNLFLDQIPGQGQVVRILDFGISKICDAEQEDLQLTRTGTVMGTPYYMSPEQVMGNTELDARSDVYACGVMLFEMLTGSKPFDGSTHNEVVVHIMSSEPPDARQIRPELDESLSTVLQKAMARERDERFSSALEFASALEEASVYRPATETFTPPSTTTISPPSPLANQPGWILPVAIGGGLVGMTLLVLMLAGFFVCKGCAATETVIITPRGIPEKANILIDDTLLPAGPFPLPRDDEPVTFTVEARGYESAEFTVIPDEDKQVRVVMKKKKRSKKSKKSDDEDEGDSKTDRKKKVKNPFRKLVRKLKN